MSATLRPDSRQRSRRHQSPPHVALAQAGEAALQDDVTAFRVPTPLKAAQTLRQALGLKLSTDVRLLTLLAARPGVVWSYAELAAAMAVSPQSVRVYAFHLRHWLHAQGFDTSLACCCGQGYSLAPDVAAALRDRMPCLDAAVTVAHEQARLRDAGRDACCAPAAISADAFPLVDHREPATPAWYRLPAAHC